MSSSRCETRSYIILPDSPPTLSSTSSYRICNTVWPELSRYQTSCATSHAEEDVGEKENEAGEAVFVVDVVVQMVVGELTDSEAGGVAV